ncbi:hypothetical protein Tco_1548547 [Tanacetum coccineum]
MLRVRQTKKYDLSEVPIVWQAPISLGKLKRFPDLTDSDSESEVISGNGIDEDSLALVKITSFEEIFSFLLPLPLSYLASAFLTDGSSSAIAINALWKTRRGVE